MTCSSVFAAAGPTVSERFQTESNETMQCTYSAKNPDLSAETLRLWLRLRYPYQSFQFPRIEEGIGPGLLPGMIQKARANVSLQEKAIDALRAQAPAAEIAELYQAVLDLLTREYRYSRIVFEFFQNRDSARLVESLSRHFELSEAERRAIIAVAENLLAGKPDQTLWTLRDQFFNNHIMMDVAGRHYSDLHQEFMKRHGIRTDCTCIKNC